MYRYLLTAAAALTVAIGIAACDDDDDPVAPTATTFTVSLNRVQEISACGQPAGATGSATVTINAANTLVTVSNLQWTGLSGGNGATMAHIHFGDPAVASGPIIFTMFSDPANPVTTAAATYTFDAADYPTAGLPAGTPTTFAAFITAMKADDSYINIHTTACAAGEIRGNLTAP